MANLKDRDAAASNEHLETFEPEKANPEVSAVNALQEDPIEARKILRKVDLRVLPLLVFVYVLTFIDRLNIGELSEKPPVNDKSDHAQEMPGCGTWKQT